MNESTPVPPRRRAGAAVVALLVAAVLVAAGAAALTGVAVAGSGVVGARPAACCPAGGPPAQPSVWPEVSASPQVAPTPLATRAASLPACIVGSWRVSSETYLVDFYTDLAAIPFTSSGRRFEFRPDGTGTIFYDDVVATSSFRGDALRVEYDGRMDFGWSAGRDTITYRGLSEVSVTWRTLINARVTNRGSEQDDPDYREVDDYQCAGDTLQESNPETGYQSIWVRTDGYGVYGR
jgi:hypothetical protein